MGHINTSLPDLLSNLNVGITLHHPETGAILDINPRLEELYGYPADELQQMEVEDYTAPNGKFTQQEAVNRIRAAAGGEPQKFDWQVERANGEFRWVKVYLSKNDIGKNSCVIAEISDITEYKSRERLLQLLSRVIRHNLRNDMSILLGYAERIQEAVEDESLEDEIDTILEVATGVGDLSDSIQEIEYITDSDITKRSQTDLRSVLEDSVEELRAKHPDAEITVEGRDDVCVVADKGLTYAIDHTLRNAIEHNDSDSPTVEVTIEESRDGNVGCVRVADNGPKIPEMEIDSIDEETEHSSTYHGSGVGLWVMKWCIESLGGSLTFGQNTPRGNIVSLSIPLYEEWN